MTVFKCRLSLIYPPSVVQVCEGDECDADAAGLGALLLRLESLKDEFLVHHPAVYMHRLPLDLH